MIEISTIPEVRQKKIIEKLDLQGKVLVSELSKIFNVSMETIRRDLEVLENQKKIKKVHGGAIKFHDDKLNEYYFKRKEKINLKNKKIIGYHASKLVEDNDIMAIDTGSTTLQIFDYILNKKNLTLLTNSIPLLNRATLYQQNNEFKGELIFLGGKINSKSMTANGQISECILEKFNLKKVFISCDGLSPENGIMFYNLDEASLSSLFIKRAEKVILMIDSSKFNLKSFYSASSLKEIDIIISNKKIPKEWEKYIHKYKIKWIIAE